MRKDERGFAHLGVTVLTVVVILVIGFAGWKIYDNNKPAPLSATSNPSKVAREVSETSPTEDDAKVPSNYTTYENKDIGFKFSYPQEWGVIVRTGDDTPTLITNGLNGHALRTVFENGVVSVLPRGAYLSGDVGPGVDEGHYSGGYIQENEKYYSIAKYTADKIQIPTERILAEVQSGLGTVLIINAGTIAGNRIQLLLNLPTGKSLSGLDLVFKNSNEDSADENEIDNTGLETLKTVARSFDAISAVQ